MFNSCGQSVHFNAAYARRFTLPRNRPSVTVFRNGVPGYLECLRYAALALSSQVTLSYLLIFSQCDDHLAHLNLERTLWLEVISSGSLSDQRLEELWLTFRVAFIPVWGATVIDHIFNRLASFQSTRPYGARLSERITKRIGEYVSIHAPVWGATVIDHIFNRLASFQSTRPYGARLDILASNKGLCLFQSTRPYGARLIF